MSNTTPRADGLTSAQIEQFINDGFIRVEQAFPRTLAGEAGTVYLCHRFLVHAAQPHRGRRPRFLAQPPLLPEDPDNRPRHARTPVEEATARALDART